MLNFLNANFIHDKFALGYIASVIFQIWKKIIAFSILTKRRKEEKTKKNANCLWLSSTASWKIKTMMTAERKKENSWWHGISSLKSNYIKIKSINQFLILFPSLYISSSYAHDKSKPTRQQDKNMFCDQHYLPICRNR